MALPRATDTYEDYTDQLVYVAARLAANQKTAHMAQDVELLLTELDARYITLRDARREEVRKRARRDLGEVMGELRALVGGNARAAYAYTQSRGGGGAGDEEAADDDAPGVETPPVEACAGKHG